MMASESPQAERATDLSMFRLASTVTIISTAVPRITHDFHSLNDVGWYGSAFFLTMSVFQTIWGKLYKSSVSTNSTGFIVGRAIAGLGGAGVIGGTYVILAYLVSPDKIPIFYGLNGIIFTLASVVGPLVGGAFTSNVAWRWCFYINLPIGGFVMVVLLLALQLPSPAQSTPLSVRQFLWQLDLPGCILILGALVCYLLVLQSGGITKPWDSAQSIGLLVGWVLLTAAFALVEWYQGEEALLASHHLRSHGILTCCIFAFFLNAANYIRIYYLPVYFQAIHNDSPERSGILLLAYIVPTSVFTLVAGALLGKVGYYQPFLLLGAAIVTIGSGLLWTLNVDSSSAKSVGYQIVVGVGDGICVQVPITAVQAFVELKDLPTVTALVLFFQLGSGVIGVAAGESVFSNRLIQSLPHYAPGITGKEVLDVGASQLEQTFDGDTLLGVKKAYLVGIKDAWILTLAFCGAAFVVSAVAPRVSILRKTEQEAGEANPHQQQEEEKGNEV
ncbi:hypothetical protein FE257_001408 [Aspergillus nanangensis]|uniref:Major facilitator superfamily (MFS) profile domain-containing protein n=1 Tax=Aspergillus nanangensis TaxID=2582783 RepID=A0AAD4CDY0_ASPNN|nr:hypothetical protein FE257_001408 [Aspergillus nanangensis]